MKTKLDLSKFKHVKSDAKTTTLQHPDGHQITLAHTALSPAYRGQLESLAKLSQAAETPLQSEERRDQAKKMADGGKVYQGEHKPAKSKALHEAEESEMPGRGGSHEQDEASFKIIRSLKGKPDEVVAIHRSVPEHVNEINPGDWVSVNKDYADLYGHIKHGGKHKVISKEVPAKELHATESIHEQGWHPEKKAEGGPIPINRRSNDRNKAEIKSHKEARDLYKSEGQERQSMFHAKMAEYHSHLMHGRHAEAAQAKAEADYHANMPQKFADGTEDGLLKSIGDTAERITGAISGRGYKTIEEMTSSPDAEYRRANNMPWKHVGAPYNYVTDALGYTKDGYYAEGGEVTSEDDNKEQQAPEENQQAKPAQVPPINININGQPANQAAPQVEQPQQKPPQRAPASIPQALMPNVAPQALQPPAPAPEQQQQAPTMAPKPAPEMPKGNILPQVTGQQLPASPEAAAQEMYQHGIAGIQKGQEAQAGMAQEMANVQQQAADTKQEMLDTYQRNVSDIDSERKALMHDIQNSYIDPEQYWTGDPRTGEGSHSRLMSALGIILAGFNPTANPNAAINYIDKAIERNMKSQELNLNAKNNLLRFNLDHFKNMRDAQDMTRIMYNDMLVNDLDRVKAKYGATAAGAEAEKLKAQLIQNMIPLQERLAIRQSMQQLLNGPGSSADKQAQILNHLEQLAPEQAKQLRERTIPGLPGIASRPIAPEVINKIESHTKLDSALKDLDKWTRTHSTIIPNPLDPEYNIGVSKALMLQQVLRESALGTVYREGEQPMLDKLIKGNPANLLKSYNTLPQIKTLFQNNDMQRKALLKTHAPEIMQQMDAAGISSSGQQSEPEIKIVKGVKYRKDPKTGKAVKVD